MNDDSFFPARPDARPTIYAYEEDNPKLAGCLKGGFTAKSVEDGEHGEGRGMHRRGRTRVAANR